MTIEELAAYSNISVDTVKRNLNRIAGVSKEDSEIPDGSRYPYNLGNSKLKTHEKRCYAMLEATFHYRYIDEKMLGLPRDSFEQHVQDLVALNYLKLNGNDNPYGLNKYNTTLEYANLRRENKYQRARAISSIITSNVYELINRNNLTGGI